MIVKSVLHASFYVWFGIEATRVALEVLQLIEVLVCLEIFAGDHESESQYWLGIGLLGK